MPDSPLTDLANLRLRTDANGYLLVTGAGAGTILGSGGADNTIPRMDGAGGLTLQSSGVTISDQDLLTAAALFSDVKLQIGGAAPVFTVSNATAGNPDGAFLDAVGVVGWTNSATDSSNNATRDTGLARSAAGVVEVNTATAGTFAGIKAGTFIAAGTATSCTGATIGAGSKNNAGFVTATTTGVSTVVLTFSFTAPTGWAVETSNRTTANLLRQSASSTTTATFTGTTVTGDVLSYIAFPF